MKFEVVVLPVADVDRAKNFYKALGWREDADFAATTRVVYSTTPGPRDGSLDWLQTVRATARWPRSATRTATAGSSRRRSEEHTSELQSRRDLVCRLLL